MTSGGETTRGETSWGETTRGRNGLGAKRPGFLNMTVKLLTDMLNLLKLIKHFSGSMIELIFFLLSLCV